MPEQNTPPVPTYSLDDAASLLSVSTARVRRLLLVGRLHGVHVGTAHRVDRQSVADLASERAARPPRVYPRTAATAATTPPNDGAKNVH